MLRIAKQTKLNPESVIDKAAKYFGQGGEGLDETGRTSCCISFEGGGGHVAVTIVEEEKQRMVDIDTREFEYHAKRFLEMV